jgi:hypothetical protein
MATLRRRAHDAPMEKYLVERTIPGAGQLTAAELAAVAHKSNGVIATMAPRLQWVQSYVTDDALVCVYLAEDEEAIREHGRRGGFPVDGVRPVRTTIDPTTAGV